MRPTRRATGVVALGGALAVLAVVLDQPSLLAGAAGTGAWLLAHQYAFVRSVRRTSTLVDVDQRATPDRPPTDQPFDVAVTASLPAPSSLDLVLEIRPPVAAVGSTREERTARIRPGHRSARADAAMWCSVAGRLEFEPPRVTATDRFGLFRTAFDRGPSVVVTVEPRTPRNVHVGERGLSVAAAYGDHPADRGSGGSEPAEIRRYLPGDPVKRVDWKATARLREPHVREFETLAAWETVLVFDHRASTGDGPAGLTKLDYARHVALSLVDVARERNDPLGLYAVGDGGITARFVPEAGAGRYTAVRRELLSLEPTALDGRGKVGANVDPARARRVAAALELDDSAFGATLRPYFDATEAYVTPLAERPLFETVRAHVARKRRQRRVWLFTDDGDRVAVREAVSLLRRRGARVAAFLTPTVLFEGADPADLERAYERYREFESFRRELARLDRVTALEVGPGDRLRDVLAAAPATGTPNGGEPR